MSLRQAPHARVSVRTFVFSCVLCVRAWFCFAKTGGGGVVPKALSAQMNVRPDNRGVCACVRVCVCFCALCVRVCLCGCVWGRILNVTSFSKRGINVTFGWGVA